MDADKEAEIVQMHLAGLKAPAIASELEISPSAVRAVLRKTTKPQPVHILDENAIIQAYASQVPAGMILKEHSISYATLYRVLAAHNIETRAAQGASGRVKQLEAAVQMYQAGSPLWAILQETGIAQPTLHAELHKRGIDLRRPRML
jgi:hypothetical protein